ncbi:MAG: 2OG-Fe(II) oxygenase [Candidatus Sericytochromatia bacterium]
MSPVQNDNLGLPISRRRVFSPEECRQILAMPFPPGAPGRIHNPENDNIDESVRKTTSYQVEPIPANRWIWERIGPLFLDMNQRYFQFRLAKLSAFQVLEYGPGGFYDWHMDIGPDRHSCRKLSAVIFLSPREDYEGGRLLFSPGEGRIGQDLGSAVIFPSYIVHRVEPVTRGQRFTLVCWALGDAFI